MVNRLEADRLEALRAPPSVDAELLREPDLNDMLDDPVLQTVMRRDGVTRKQILSLMLAFRARQFMPAPKLSRDRK